jgi:predicted DNA-binding antitoxin AbrB/MazE fold protein
MSSIHVKARFKDGVFVPEKPLLLPEDTEVLVVIDGGQAEAGPRPASSFQAEARRHFKAHFPDLEVDEALLELVGALQGVNGPVDIAGYRDYLQNKYR